MPTHTFSPGCHGCEISQSARVPFGSIRVDLEGGWTLNHYGGSEGFLGWLALQPRFHRMELAQLTLREARAIGPNIRRVDAALRGYWQQTFGDPVRRVYVLYFHEGVFDRDPSPYHLHFHLIPRSDRLDPVLRQTGPDIVAWDMYRASRLPGFPPEYLRNETFAHRLMTHLQAVLASDSSGLP